LICISGQKEKLKNESDEEFLKRISHVQLNGKEIEKIVTRIHC
jgi:hypothetical protein